MFDNIFYLINETFSHLNEYIYFYVSRINQYINSKFNLYVCHQPTIELSQVEDHPPVYHLPFLSNDRYIECLRRIYDS